MAITRRLIQNFSQQTAIYKYWKKPSGRFLQITYEHFVAKKERLVSERIPKTYIMLESFLPLDFYFGDVTRLRGVLLACTVYLIYYLIQVVKRPILACSDGPFKEFLVKNIPTLDIKYWPTFWCVESRVQTVLAVILRSQIVPPVNYRREILTLSDGGIVALDWLEDGCAENAPCIIILPGITGASQADYIKCLVLAANNAGIRVVVFQNRGLGGVELKTPRFYCASKYDDLSEVVQHVRKVVPHCKLGAAGISMGGLVLGNYLAHRSEEARAHLTAAKIISVPWDVHKATTNVEKPIFNFLLGRHLVKTLSNNVITQMQQHKEVFKDVKVDFERMSSVRTLREFDDIFTSKQFGYGDVNDYYADATLHNKLHHIKVPLLCLSAADDPFQPLEGIPIKSAEECSHVAIIVTARGGHIGFLEGWWPWNREQYMGRIFVEYFTKVFHDDDGEFEKVRSKMHDKFIEQNTLKLNECVE